uniref:Leucine-rich repeat-containing G-protein coupled receptor 5-like n=1 Tax=Saccoglossus kowalevskii TaxID=10224 RepID=A0ABM0MWJ6_SACKO
MSWQITLFIYVMPIILMNSGRLKGCPSECICEDSDGELHVDCSHGGLSEIPSNIPSNTTKLVLDSNELTSLPETVFKELPNLKQLNISHNSLTSLPDGIFHNLTDLTTLDLSYNNLQSLNSSLFDGLYNLHVLRLYDNDITFLPSTTFHSLTKLSFLNVRDHHNKMSWQITLFIYVVPILLMNSGTLKGCPFECSCEDNDGELHVDCSHGGLSEIPSNISSDTTRLVLEYNDLITIPEHAFIDLHGLVYINLGWNGITEISAKAFVDVSNLTELKLHRNGLTSLPETVFDELPNLKKLDISYNSLTFLPSEIFHNLTDLTELDLSYNNLQSLNSTLFDGLNNLLELRLYGNDLTFLPTSIKVTYLNFGYNEFSQFPDTIQRLSNLRYLYLYGNEIKHLPNFHNFTKLQMLKLSDNPWSCDCHMEAFKRWIHNNTQVDTQLICQFPIEYTGTDIVNLAVSDLQCVPPKFNNSFEYVYVEVNEPVTLTVDVNGVPLPHIQWIPPNGIVIGTAVDSVVRLEPDGSIFITSVQKDLVGPYVCIANNDKGHDGAVRYLQIRSLPLATTTYSTTLTTTSYMTEATNKSASSGVISTTDTTLPHSIGQTTDKTTLFHYTNVSSSQKRDHLCSYFDRNS